MALFADLPVELLLHVVWFLPRRQAGLSSLSCCSKSLRHITLDILLDNTYKRHMEEDSATPRHMFLKAFIHAIRCDSIGIMQWLISRDMSAELNKPVVMSKALGYISCLHCAILYDAPKVAIQLVKFGADIYTGDVHYPDLAPLYLAISQPQIRGKGLDYALGIACSYALPRMTEYILVRGASPNNEIGFGMAAMHMAVRKRLPWRYFKVISWSHTQGGKSEFDHWDSMLASTISALLRFGGDANLRSFTTRTHVCGHDCWRSVDCEHPGQRVLHFAAANGSSPALKVLLEHGADPEGADDQGHLPLFSALVQGHIMTTLCLLEASSDLNNLIVVRRSKSTALHIACRFAMPGVVSYILTNGADPDVRDSTGQTPLHEVLGQTNLGLKHEVIGTLKHLAEFGASPDSSTLGGEPIWKLGARHTFPSVRDMFGIVDDRRMEWDGETRSEAEKFINFISG